jgi:hypothetical protein
MSRRLDATSLRFDSRALALEVAMLAGVAQSAPFAPGNLLVLRAPRTANVNFGLVERGIKPSAGIMHVDSQSTPTVSSRLRSRGGDGGGPGVGHFRRESARARVARFRATRSDELAAQGNGLGVLHQQRGPDLELFAVEIAEGRLLDGAGQGARADRVQQAPAGPKMCMQLTTARPFGAAGTRTETAFPAWRPPQDDGRNAQKKQPGWEGRC